MGNCETNQEIEDADKHPPNVEPDPIEEGQACTRTYEIQHRESVRTDAIITRLISKIAGLWQWRRKPHDDDRWAFAAQLLVKLELL